jgi:hypothetical protein
MIGRSAVGVEGPRNSEPASIRLESAELRTSLTRRLHSLPDERFKEFHANLLKAQLSAMDDDMDSALLHLEVARVEHPGEIEARLADFISAGLLCSQFRWAATELSSLYSLSKPIHISVGDPVEPVAPAIRWDIDQAGESSFICNHCLWTPRFMSGFVRWVWLFPLIAEFLKGEVISGSTYLNLGDIGWRPGLAFCDNRSDYLLIPDPSFINTKAYQRTATTFAKREKPWADRIPIAYWRGATTGDSSRGWRNLPRVRLCLIGQSEIGRPLIDAGLTVTSGLLSQPETVAELHSAGVMRPYASVEESLSYKYQIDIDGHTNSWPGLFQKLLSGSPVLKVASPAGYRQWYYERLRPWFSYVPVLADLSDLVEKVLWLKDHDEQACTIGIRGRELAAEMGYEAELRHGSRTIGTAFRTKPDPSRSVTSSRIVLSGGGMPPNIAESGQPMTPNFGLQPGSKKISAAQANTPNELSPMNRLYGRDIWQGFYPTRQSQGEVQGWNGKHPVFDKLLREIPIKIIVDVGVWKGQSTIFMAKILHKILNEGEHGCVIAVDTFLGSPEHWRHDGRLFERVFGMPDIYRTFLENVFFEGVHELVVPLPQTSANAARILNATGLRVGLVHVDASHDYESVLQDATNYWPLLAAGGVLVGDDYHETWPGVVRAADEFAAKVGLEITVIMPKWIIRKPK